MIEEINGCLGDGAKDQDWKISGEMVFSLPELEKQDQVIFEYNQGNSVDCTIYSALGALSDLRNRELTQEQIDETVEESFNRGRVRGEGWYVQSAVNLACDMREKRYPKEKVVFYRIASYEDGLIEEIINKNYTLCTGYNGNAKYQRDRADNGQIDNDKFGASTYGHAVGLIGRENKKFVKDNYKGRVENGRYTNIYEVLPKISRLNETGLWHYYSYLIVKVKSDEEDIERLNKMKNMIDRMIEDNSAMFHLTNNIGYKAELHKMNDENRKTKANIEHELAKYFIS